VNVAAVGAGVLLERKVVKLHGGDCGDLAGFICSVVKGTHEAGVQCLKKLWFYIKTRQLLVLMWYLRLGPISTILP